MPADHTKPAPVLDFASPLPADPPSHGRHRRRALRPAVVVTAAVAATALGATVGTLAYGSGVTEQASFSAAVGPEATAATAPEAAVPEVPEATNAVPPSASAAARVGVRTADQARTGPGSGVPAPGRSAATGPPTGTGAVGGPRSAAGPTPTAPATGDAAAESAVLTLVNQERANAGCGALTVDARLTAAARAHSADMAGRQYFAHDTPDGVTVGTRVTQAGYRWSLVGENIAKGQPDAVAVMKAWMNSAGHRANILNCRFTDIGIGLARQGRTPVWTQDFGRPL